MTAIWRLLFVFWGLFIPAVLAENFSVHGKVSGISGNRQFWICDGVNFHPIDVDGKYDFSFSTEETPFIYLLMPGNFRCTDNARRSVVSGRTRHDFTVEAFNPPRNIWRIAAGSDIQYNFEQREAQRKNDTTELRQILNRENCAFLTLPGDIVVHGTSKEYQLIKPELESIGKPYYPAYGAHDGMHNRPRSGIYTRNFGAFYYSWNFGKIHFITLASELNQLSPGEIHRQNQWLHNDFSLLPPGTSVIILAHTPWEMSQQLNQLARQTNTKITLFLGAHVHRNYISVNDHQPIITSPALSGKGKGMFTKRLRILDLDENGLPIRTTSRLLNIRNLQEAFLMSTGIHATAFDTKHDIGSMEFEIVPGGPKGKLRQTGKFSWDTNFSTPLPAGSYQVKLTAFTECGQKKTKTFHCKLGDRAQPHLLWTYSTGSQYFEYPTPTIENGKLYLGLADGELPVHQGGGVICLEAASGKIIWRTPLPADITAQVAVNKDKLWALGSNALLYQLDATTGKLLQQKKVVDNLRNGVLFLANGKCELKNGRLFLNFIYDGKYHFQVCDPQTLKPLYPDISAPTAGGSWTGFTIAEDSVYYVCGPTIGAFSVSSGKNLWKIRTDPKEYWWRSLNNVPLVSGERLFCSLGVRGSLLCLDRRTGTKLVESKSFPGEHRNGFLFDQYNNMILMTGNNCLVLLDANTCKIISKTTTPQAPVEFLWQFPKETSNPLVFSDAESYLVLFNTGSLVRFSKNLLQQKTLWKCSMAFRGNPVLIDEIIYMVGFDGVVYAVNINGASKKRFSKNTEKTCFFSGT